MTERLFGRGRRGGVLLIAGAVLGAAIAGPGATIAQKAMNLNTTTGDKRYVKRAELLAAGKTEEAPLTKFTTTSFAPIASATIKAPGPGFLVVNGSLSAKDDGAIGDDKLEYRLAVGTTPGSTTATSFELFMPHLSGRQNGSVDGIFKVARKGPQTVTLQAQNVAPSTGVDILGRSLTATFIPKVKTVATKPTTGKKPAGGNVSP
ncbi:MAG: hypothetical protein M3M99_06855 [Actinomycetota bacterium]|nr:hypothetical protein [Actinomycetota bacterium]